VLSELGWEASDELKFFEELATALEEFPQWTNGETRYLERQLLSGSEQAEIALQYNAGITRKSIDRQ
jgi:hypothetical protein